MRLILLFSLSLSISCASPNRQPAVAVESETQLELGQALSMGPVAAVARLRSQITSKSFAGLDARDPASALPSTLRAEKPVKASTEKNLQSVFIRKFRPWKMAKKIKRAQELTEDFGCESAMETQALAFVFEIDFPATEATSWSQALHEKVLKCQAFNPQESLFKLAIFAIQKNECSRANEYLDMFPATPERGVNDRIAYVRSLCGGASLVENRNPWGGYGILLTDAKPEARNSPKWMLSVSSGSEDWDRLLASYVELHEQNQQATIHYLATKINYVKFRALPISFQASVMALMNFSGADLPVFQTLHKYLSEHPDMIEPSVARLLFPTRYWEQIVQNSLHADPILVKSLIRQESAFNPLARSRARASGLMQLIFPTAKVFGIKKPSQLLDPPSNIQAGSEFLAQLVSQFGSVELALAAYNAGPAIVRQWQKRYPTDNINIFVEMIPYSETREYVRLVQRNFKIYQTMLVKPPQVLGAN